MLEIAWITLAVFMVLAFPADAAEEKNLSPGTYAVFETNMGSITFRLFKDEAPQTVSNFIGLAEGAKEWLDPKTKEKVKKPFYDGLIFHRIIPDFMIQGGDPEGTGAGGPGFTFEDEFSPKLKHDKPGRLSMANRGPNTNGSQFFITLVPTPWLDKRHTIFGEVVDGMDVIEKIAKVPKGNNDRPLKEVVIERLRIVKK